MPTLVQRLVSISSVHWLERSLAGIQGGGPGAVVKAAGLLWKSEIAGSNPALSFKLQRNQMFRPCLLVNIQYCGDRDREVASSASDRQGSNFESYVWRAVSSRSPQMVLLAQLSLYVHLYLGYRTVDSLILKWSRRFLFKTETQRPAKSKTHSEGTTTPPHPTGRVPHSTGRMAKGRAPNLAGRLAKGRVPHPAGKVATGGVADCYPPDIWKSRHAYNKPEK